jgi:CRISPR-associated protein Csm1
MLNYFFSACINQAIRTNKEYRNIYIVYSGGDDLCLIGPWTAVIKFSNYIHKLFEKYVGSNPSLTISGGIALFDHNTPLKYVASRADSLLDISKNEKGKNKITIFGQTVSWKVYEKLIELGEQFFKGINENHFSSGLMHRILNYGKRKREFESGYLIQHNALWHSHFLYDVARNIKDLKTMEWLIKEVLENIDNISVAVSYALYKARRMEVKKWTT